MLNIFIPDYVTIVNNSFSEVAKHTPANTLKEYVNPNELQAELTQINKKTTALVKSIFEKEIPEIVNHKSVAISFTGSDGRNEKMSVSSPYEIQVIFNERNNYDPNLIEKIKNLTQSHIFFHPTLEIKFIDTDCLLSFDRNQSLYSRDEFPFPTRALDAQYLTGSLEVMKHYKEEFFDQLANNPDSGKKISKFRTSAFKGNAQKALMDAKKNNTIENGFDLKTGALLYKDGEKRSIKSIKYAFLRYVQYYTAVEFCRALHGGRVTLADAVSYPPSIIERVDWLVQNNILNKDNGNLLKNNYAASLIIYAQCQRAHELNPKKEEGTVLQADQPLLRNLMDGFLRFN